MLFCIAVHRVPYLSTCKSWAAKDFPATLSANHPDHVKTGEENGNLCPTSEVSRKFGTVATAGMRAYRFNGAAPSRARKFQSFAVFCYIQIPANFLFYFTGRPV